MIKKIGAILLALVLCLGVVVVPASAYELASSSEIAYVVELDKENYSAGEYVTVNLYLYGKEGLEFGTGAILIAMNSDVFDMSENAVADIKETATSGDAMASWYKDFSAASVAWVTQATVITNVTNSNTAEENAMYNQYLKIGLAKNTSGTHANVAGNKNGLPAEDINADSDAGIPFVSFKLKLKDDLADGTAVNVGITTGSMTKNQTYVNYYKNPGVATTVVKTKTATSEVTSSTTSTIGAAVTPLTVVPMKQQIKYNDNGSFNYRIIAELDNFWDIFENAEDAIGPNGTLADGTTGADDGLYIKEAGFIYNRGAAVDTTKALAQINAGSGEYLQQSRAYVSTNYNGKVAMACVVYNIPADEATDTLSVLAYIKYVQDGEEKVAYCDAYTGTFTLYQG